MKRVLITTGNGMFGKALAQELLSKEVLTRVMVRNRSKCDLEGEHLENTTGDLDRPDTLEPVMEGVDAVFLASPMDRKMVKRETAVIDAAKQAGANHLVKIYGSVRHEGDELDAMHLEVLDHMKNSGLQWTMVSPNSVMETSFLDQADSIKYMHALVGCSGHGKIGLVALQDVTAVSAIVLTSEGHEGKNYELTGPESIDLVEVAERFSKVLGKKIVYVDLSEEKLTKMMMKYDKTMTPERVDIEILCHLRAWQKGNADLVTDAYEKVTGNKATAIDEFIADNREHFTKGMIPGIMARLVRFFA